MGYYISDEETQNLMLVKHCCNMQSRIEHSVMALQIAMMIRPCTTAKFAEEYRVVDPQITNGVMPLSKQGFVLRDVDLRA